jgi:hypothetical protein
MKLITEEAQDIKVLTEERNGKKTFYIQGIFMEANSTNRNKRQYSRDVLENAVNDYVKTYVNENRALGELGHPPGPSINLDRVSHIIESLKQDGNRFIGKAKLLDTPMGKIAQNLYEAGIKLGISTRGVGSLIPTQYGYSMVAKDFKLATADIVHDPSCQTAFVEGIMEGVNWLYDTNKQEYIASNMKKQIEKDAFNNRLTEERKLLHFENYLSML